MASLFFIDFVFLIDSVKFLESETVDCLHHSEVLVVAIVLLQFLKGRVYSLLLLPSTAFLKGRTHHRFRRAGSLLHGFHTTLGFVYMRCKIVVGMFCKNCTSEETSLLNSIDWSLYICFLRTFSSEHCFMLEGLQKEIESIGDIGPERLEHLLDIDSNLSVASASFCISGTLLFGNILLSLSMTLSLRTLGLVALLKASFSFSQNSSSLCANCEFLLTVSSDSSTLALLYTFLIAFSCLLSSVGCFMLIFLFTTPCDWNVFDNITLFRTISFRFFYCFIVFYLRFAHSLLYNVHFPT
ncbi:unnamed protein product [Moneuplotes crassus]|uniref:Uncharacterized protein n=1 Tax=Euplotes crassus TaxID=5936 RepID=A0AAD1XDQ7_EUPCR|nr:unnamed protein product [Moneuplotes crassus]